MKRSAGIGMSIVLSIIVLSEVIQFKFGKRTFIREYARTKS